MKRKQWMQLGLVASSMLMLTGCYQRYQRQSSPKKRQQRQTSAKKQAKKQITNNYTSLFFRLPKDLCDFKGFGCYFQIE